MDPGRNIIPIVEDDMGEGMMDPIDQEKAEIWGLVDKLEDELNAAKRDGKALKAARLSKRLKSLQKRVRNNW